MNRENENTEKKLVEEISSAYNGDYNIAIYGDENGEIETMSFFGSQTYTGSDFYVEFHAGNPQGNWEYENEDELEEMIEEKALENTRNFLSQFETWLSQSPEEREETRTGDYR